MNIAEWIGRAGRGHSGLPAVAAGRETVRTYRETAGRAARLAAGLRDAGLKPGDRIAILARNSPDYIELLFGAWWAGMGCVPINAKLHADEVTFILENSGASILFASADLVETAAMAARAAGVMREPVEIGSGGHLALLADREQAMAEVSPDDLAWLFYTSGTTGRPKGAMLTHRNLAHMTYGYLASVAATRPGQSVLHAAPMSHGSGLYILPHIVKACCNVVPEGGGFDPAAIVDAVDAWPGMAMFAAPTMANRLVRWPGDVSGRVLENLKVIVVGGAPMYVEDTEAFLDRFGPRLAQIYGQGESPMNITCLDRETLADRSDPRWRDIAGSAGLPFPNVEVRIADGEDRSVATGESGEILCRGDSVMAGYWQRPEATAETLRGGWLHTGDVGRLDDRGYLTLMDRSKDLIISGGSNIYPREVEETLLTHPAVREVSVIGRRDKEWGEVVVAYVVADADAGVTQAMLDAVCLERIARFKRPKDYVFVEALPKNNYGKILKTELRAADAAERE